MIKVFAVAAVTGLACAAHGAVLADWTFEVSVPATAGPHLAEAGVFAASSNASGFHVSTAAVYSNPVGNGSLESFSSNDWAIGDYYQFQTSTSGYTSITIQWDQASSNTGPRDFRLDMSTDGVNFAPLFLYSVLANASPNPTWSSGTPQPIYNIGPISAPGGDNQASLFFRLVNTTTVSANGGTVAATGTDRVDNVRIEGTLIPTPGSLALLGIGAAFAARRRRAR